MLARIDDAMEPILAEARFSARSLMQLFGSVCKKDGYRLLRRRAGKRFRHGVAPELHAHHANGGGARCVGDKGDVDVEGADGEVGIAGRGWDEGLEDVGGGVVGSGWVSGGCGSGLDWMR